MYLNNNIPNCTSLVRFGGMSGEFGQAMVRILARHSRAKIPMAVPNKPDKVTTPCTGKCGSDSEFQPCFSWHPLGVKGRDYIVCDS